MQCAVTRASQGLAADADLSCDPLPHQLGDESMPGVVLRYMARAEADRSRDALLNDVSIYNICAKYERLRTRLDSTLCRSQWQALLRPPPPDNSILWSSWVLWRFWLKDFEKWSAMSTEDIEDTLELLTSHCNVLAFLAIRLAADPKARYLFLRMPFVDDTHSAEMLCEVLVTVVALRQRKLAEVADRLRAANGEAAISVMKLQFLQSLLDYAEEKLIGALLSLSV